MEPQASSPYRRLYGYRSEGNAPAHAPTHTYTPDSHTSSQKSEHIPPAHYRRIPARWGK